MSYKGRQAEFGPYQLRIGVLSLFAQIVSPPEVDLSEPSAALVDVGQCKRCARQACDPSRLSNSTALPEQATRPTASPYPSIPESVRAVVVDWEALQRFPKEPTGDQPRKPKRDVADTRIYCAVSECDMQPAVHLQHWMQYSLTPKPLRKVESHCPVWPFAAPAKERRYARARRLRPVFRPHRALQ